jgi:NADH-quinone oxidoreductase subunit F
MVIDAIAAGRRGALAIDKYLRRDASLVQMYDRKGEISEKPTSEEMEEEWKTQPRVAMSILPPEERKRSFAEIECGFSEEQGREEAKRCLRCDLET